MIAHWCLYDNPAIFHMSRIYTMQMKNGFFNSPNPTECSAINGFIAKKYIQTGTCLDEKKYFLPSL